MVEKTLRLPFVIRIKTYEDSIVHYALYGNIVKKSKTCILLEETTTWEKSKDNDSSQSLTYDKSEQKRPYVVILLDGENDLLESNHEYDARFFDNFEDALRYYSCFSLKETNGDAHG